MSTRRREIGVVETGQASNIDFVGGRLDVGEIMSPPVIGAVKKHVESAGTVIIDVPPGTSCPVVEAVRDVDFCLLVTEDTPFGLNDLSLAVDLTKLMGIPAGVVVNRDGSGWGEVEAFCQEKGIPILLRIPLERRIAELYCRGTTLVEGLPQWHKPFLDLFRAIEDRARARV